MSNSPRILGMPARTGGDPPGLRLEALARWLDDALPDVPPGPVRAEPIAGGKSNLTYIVRRGEWTAVLRRPPLGHVLATAHDMAREYRVITALRTSAVPAPEPLALCEDAGVIGAPFYVMSYVPGRSFRTAADLSGHDPARVRRITEELVDTLVALHLVDPKAVGLETFGRPEGFLPRQVRRWRTQLEASRTRALPDADVLHDLLTTRMPPDPAIAVVHGDYRLDNLLIADDDTVAAVTDWEMSTLGDPVTDVAMLLVYHRLALESAGDLLGDAPRAPGYLSESAVLARYSHGVGRRVDDIGFYLGLASYKLAIIMEGIRTRHLQGDTVGPGFDAIGGAVRPLLRSGIELMHDRSP